MESAATRKERPGADRPVAELTPGQAFAGEYVCARKDRLTAKNGSAYLSLELRDRTGTIPARMFRDVDRIGLGFERGDVIAVSGRVERFRGQLSAEVDAAVEGRPRAGRSDRVPADRLPQPGRARGLPRAPDPRGPQRRAARGGRAAALHRPGRRRVPPRTLHPGRPPLLCRRADRAHGRGRHPGHRDLHPSPAAELRPADGRRADPRHRQDRRVHLRSRDRPQRARPGARPPPDRGRADHRGLGRPRDRASATRCSPA